MKKDRGGIMKGLAFVTQFAVIMLSPIILCLFLGKWLDSRFATGNVITLVMLFLGVAAAYRNAYVTLRNNFLSGKKDADGENKDDDGSRQ